MRKLISFFVLVSMLFCASAVDARNGWQGCCSWHGGIAGYCQNGRMVCNDGTLSPSCLCDDPGEYSYQTPITPRTRSRVISSGDWWAELARTYLGVLLNTQFRADDPEKNTFPIDLSPGFINKYSGFINIYGIEFGIQTHVDIPYKNYKKSKK